MSWQKTVKGFIGMVTGEMLVGALDQVKDTVEQTTRKVIKTVTLYVLFIIGLLFLLVGLAHYLQAQFVWTDGLGLIVVGLVVMLLGFFAKAMR